MAVWPSSSRILLRHFDSRELLFNCAVGRPNSKVWSFWFNVGIFSFFVFSLSTFFPLQILLSHALVVFNPHIFSLYRPKVIRLDEIAKKGRKRNNFTSISCLRSLSYLIDLMIDWHHFVYYMSSPRMNHCDNELFGTWFHCFLFRNKKQMGTVGERRLGLSTAKDAGYSKLIVFCSAILSGFTFGLPVFGGVLTGKVRFFSYLGLH